MAEGPMSTPRLSWPRSMGTPRMPGGLRAPSNKGHTPRAPRVGGGLERTLRGAPDGVDPAEVHVRSFEGEYLLVAAEVARGGTRLVGEEPPLGVEARGEDRGLERHPEVEHVHERLQDGGRDAGCPGRAKGYETTLLRGDDGRAHAGDEPLAGLEGVEPFGVELGLSQSVVQRDAGAGNDEPGSVAHRGGDGDGEPVGVDAGDVRCLRRAEDSPALLPGVLLAREPSGYDLVLRPVHVGDLAIAEGEPHSTRHNPGVFGPGEGCQIVARHYS